MTAYRKEPVSKCKHIIITMELAVRDHDEPEPMSWHEAMAKYGPNGTDKEWRLPTRLELLAMYEFREKMGIKFEDTSYLSSSEHDYNYVWGQSFDFGGQNLLFKRYTHRVRCVRR